MEGRTVKTSYTVAPVQIKPNQLNIFCRAKYLSNMFDQDVKGPVRLLYEYVRVCTV